MILANSGYSYDVDLSRFTDRQQKHIIKTIKLDQELNKHLKGLYKKALTEEKYAIPLADYLLRLRIASIKEL